MGFDFDFVAKETPKQVQDIAGEGGDEIPASFLQLSLEPSNDDNDVTTDELSKFATIPLIDTGCIPDVGLDESVTPDEKEVLVANEIAQACKEWGFFQIVNHGIPNELVQKIKDKALEYFHMPVEDRVIDWTTLPLPKSGVRDWNDALIHFIKPARPDFVPREKMPEGYREVLNEYSDEVFKLCHRLQRAMSIGLGLKPGRIQEAFGEVGAATRMNYYPPCPKPEKVSGLTSHSDAVMMTVLNQNAVEGLQVLKNKRWITVPVVPNSLVINVGDLMQFLTNGEFISNEHRAIVNQTAERQSVVTFLIPPERLPVGPLPELVDAKHPQLYKFVCMKDYFEQVQKGGLEGKSPLDTQRLPQPIPGQA